MKLKMPLLSCTRMYNIRVITSIYVNNNLRMFVYVVCGGQVYCSITVIIVMTSFSHLPIIFPFQDFSLPADMSPTLNCSFFDF